MTTHLVALEKILNSWRIWFRIRRSASWAAKGLIASLAISLLFSLVAVLRGWLIREEYVWVILAASLAGMLLAGTIAFAWPFPLLRAARHFDRIFDLRERTSTALELATGARSPGPGSELLQRQMEDALAAASRVNPRQRLPIRIRLSEIAAALILIAGVILVWAWGGPYFQVASQKRAVRNAIRQEIAKIEALQGEIGANPSLTPEQAAALAGLLEDALEKLRRARSQEQAVSALHEAQEQLQALASSEQVASARERYHSLQEAGNGLRRQPGSPLQSFGESLAGGDLLEATQDLQNLDPGNLSAQQAEALADQLDELASGLAATDPGLAQQLRQAAEALRRGDAAAARQALQQASQALTQTGRQVALAQSAAGAAAQAAQGQAQILQAGRSAGNQPGIGQPQTGSQGPGDGQGAGGQPSNAGSRASGAQSDAGGGAGRGEGNGEAGQGSAASDDPIGQGNAPGDAGESPYEQIYAPQRLGGSEGEPVTVPGSGQPGDQLLGRGNTAPGTPGDSRVPYVDVLPLYEEAYRQAIESGDVPLYLRDLVRKYFSSLQP